MLHDGSVICLSLIYIYRNSLCNGHHGGRKALISTGAGAQSSHLIHKQRERETHAGNGVRFYFYLFVCLLLAFRDRFSLCSNPNCSGNSSCRASWTWAHRDSPKSACWVLGLKACTTTAQLEWAFITLKPHPVTLLRQEPYLLIPSKQ